MFSISKDSSNNLRVASMLASGHSFDFYEINLGSDSNPVKSEKAQLIWSDGQFISQIDRSWLRRPPRFVENIEEGGNSSIQMLLSRSNYVKDDGKYIKQLPTDNIHFEFLVLERDPNKLEFQLGITSVLHNARSAMRLGRQIRLDRASERGATRKRRARYNIFICPRWAASCWAFHSR